MSNRPSNPRDERRCHVGNDANGNVFEKYVRAEWADAEIERLTAELAEARKPRLPVEPSPLPLVRELMAERDRLRAALEGVVAAYIDGAKAMVIIAREALAGAAIQHKLNCNSLQPCDCGALTGGEK